MVIFAEIRVGLSMRRKLAKLPADRVFTDIATALLGAATVKTREMQQK